MATIMELFVEWKRLDAEHDWEEEPAAGDRARACLDEMWEIKPKTPGELAAIFWAVSYHCQMDLKEDKEKALLWPLIEAEQKPSEIMAIFRQWYDLVMLINAGDFLGRPDAEAYLDGLHEQRHALLDRVSALEPATAEETMAQVIMTCDFGEEWLSNSHWGQPVRDRFAARLGISFPSYVQA